MKTLKIKNEIENLKSSYEFNLKFMHGDADGYSTETIDVSENHPKLLEFANFLDSLKGRNEAEKKHSNFFEKVENDVDYEELHFDYPYDNTSDYSHPASCQGLKIYYYDSNGKKFQVELS